jgi:hypothetical protein
MGDKSIPTWPTVMVGDKIIHVSEVPMLHPARLWPVVAPLTRDRAEQTRIDFIELMHRIKTNASLERAQPGQDVEDDLLAIAYRLSQAMKVVVRLGTKRGEAGVGTIARLNGRLQWPSSGIAPLTFDQWQDVIGASISIFSDEARRIDEARRMSGRKGKRGRRPKEARGGSLNDLKEFWSKHGSAPACFQDFLDALNSGIVAERKRHPCVPHHHLLGEKDTRRKALARTTKRSKRK